MLNLDDIVSLAKQGYKPSDIKELIELSKTSEASSEDLSEPEEQLQKSKEDLPKPEEIAPIQGAQSKVEEPEDKKVVDYKKKVEELEAKLSELQKANTRKNIADTDEKSDSDVVADLMKSFM